MQKSLSVFHVFQPFINSGIHKFLASHLHWKSAAFPVCITMTNSVNKTGYFRCYILFNPYREQTHDEAKKAKNRTENFNNEYFNKELTILSISERGA